MRWLLVSGVVVLLAGCVSLSTDDWLRQLKEPDVVKRRQAIRELGSRTAEAPNVVPALTEALHDGNGYVRHDAALSLAKFGVEAREAVPVLVTALKDKEQSVRKAAGLALRKIDPPAAAKAGLR